MDKRKNNGGARKGAGRPSKANESDLIERLDAIIDKDEVIETLKKLAIDGDTKAITLYMNYRFGKPKETKDIKLEVEKDFPGWLDES